MTLLPEPSWMPVVLALVLATDIVLTAFRPKFIRDCLDGVGFPREWWWALTAIKATAVAGLIAGLWLPGVGLAATAGVVAYFGCAAFAHLRARYLTVSFWVNCLGMLMASSATLLFAYLV